MMFQNGACLPKFTSEALSARHLIDIVVQIACSEVFVCIMALKYYVPPFENGVVRANFNQRIFRTDQLNPQNQTNDCLKHNLREQNAF